MEVSFPKKSLKWSVSALDGQVYLRIVLRNFILEDLLQGLSNFIKSIRLSLLVLPEFSLRGLGLWKYGLVFASENELQVFSENSDDILDADFWSIYWLYLLQEVRVDFGQIVPKLCLYMFDIQQSNLVIFVIKSSQIC